MFQNLLESLTDIIFILLFLVLKLPMTARDNPEKYEFRHLWVENEAFLAN